MGLAVGLGVAVGAPAASAATASSGRTPGAALWARALSAARAQTSVSYVEVSTGGGQTTVIAGQVNRTSGTQQLTFTTAHHRGAVTVTLIGRTTYVKGNSYGLQQAVGMPAALGSQFSGQWISITPSDSKQLFNSTAAELSMSSVISNFDMTGPYSIGRPTRRPGGTVLVVRGYETGTGSKRVPQTFDLSARRHPLPVASLTVLTGGTAAVRMTSTYSHWGEPVSVTAPSGAIPITSLLQQGGGGATTPTTAPQIVTAGFRA